MTRELDENAVRAHVRRRSGGAADPATIDRIVAAIHEHLRLDRQRSASRRIVTLPPLPARLGLAAALVVAISLIVVPMVGGPGASTSPSADGSSTVSTPASSAGTDALQVLSLDELQRVTAQGNTQPYRDGLVVADVDLLPDSPPSQCVYVLAEGQSVPSTNTCWVDSSVVGSAPAIKVIQPSRDTDILRPSVPLKGMTGPILLRIDDVNTVELIGELGTSVGSVAWSPGAFIHAVDHMPRTMEFAPYRFVVGPPFVVEANLLAAPPTYCPLQESPSPSRDRMSQFECGTSAWLAPVDVVDPTTLVDGSGRPADWVRVQNGAATSEPQRGFYVVLPLIKYDAQRCFDCGGGAVALLYARLEPIPIP